MRLLGGGRPTKEQAIGVYGLNENKPRNLITIFGRDRCDVARRALDYWYENPRRRGITLKQFLQRCRLSRDERTIVFRMSA